MFVERQNKLLINMENEGIKNLLITKMENVFYYSGFRGTFGVLYVWDNRFFLITDGRYIEQANDQGNNIEIVPIKVSIASSVEGIYKPKKLYIEGYDVCFDLYSSLCKELKTKSVLSAGDIVQRARVEKDEFELEIIEEAVKIADDTFSYIVEYIEVGMTEKQVADEMEYFMKKQGASSSSFETIVASGKRSSLPHGVASDKIIENGDVILLDYGAVYKGYCSDMSRTIFLGNTNSKIKEIYDIVLEAQLEVSKKVCAGMTLKNVDAIARDIIKRYGYGDMFVHSLGHGIGLEIHETPIVSHSADGILLERSVISNEPGIYLEGIGGVRIEDLLYIEKEGARVLTKSSKDIFII